MPSVDIVYKDPTTGTIKSASASISIELSRDLTSSVGIAGYLKISRPSGEDARLDVTQELQTLVYGNGQLARPGMYMTRLTAQETLASPADATLAVENSGAPTAALPRGLNAAVGDPIAIVNKFKADGTPHTVEFVLVASVPGGTSITYEKAGAAAGLTNTFYKGAMLFNLRYGTIPAYGTGWGSNRLDGLKTYYETPAAPSTVGVTYSATQFNVTITANSSIKIAQKYAIYVRSNLDEIAMIEPHWVADLETTTTGSSVAVTTSDGGSAAGGANIVAATTYNIFVAAMDFTDSNAVPSTAKGVPYATLRMVAA